MKKLINILFILLLVAAFSSCHKTEIEGLEDATFPTKSKSIEIDDSTDSKGDRTAISTSSTDDDDIIENADGDVDITDDEDDEEDNEDDDQETSHLD